MAGFGEDFEEIEKRSIEKRLADDLINGDGGL
jgi:hypothetical protein